MVSTRDVQLTDGRLVRVHDTGDETTSDALTVLWHHGSPQTGALLEPLLTAAAARGIRLLSYARPSYGGASSHQGRNVASAAGDVAQVLDRSASNGPRSWARPVVVRTSLPALPSCPGA